MYYSSDGLQRQLDSDNIFNAEDDDRGLHSAFEALACRHGMGAFLVTRFPKGDMPEFSANLLLSNWPEDLRDAYGSVDVFGFSKLIALLKSGIRPTLVDGCVFGDAQSSSTKENVEAIFAGRGMSSNLVFSIHSADLNHYVFVFSGNRKEMPQAEIREIYFSTMELIDTRFDEYRPEGPRERLSGRELECLRWSAAGKSSEEIALILNISSHTVVSYLKSAMRKLDSVNRMQAVARACRFRLL